MKTYTPTHLVVENLTRKQVVNRVIKAMNDITLVDNGTLRTPYELASSVLPNGSMLIEEVAKNGYCRYNDGWYIVEVDEYSLYVDLTSFAINTMYENGEVFEYGDIVKCLYNL